MAHPIRSRQEEQVLQEVLQEVQSELDQTQVSMLEDKMTSEDHSHLSVVVIPAATSDHLHQVWADQMVSLLAVDLPAVTTRSLNNKCWKSQSTIQLSNRNTCHQAENVTLKDKMLFMKRFILSSF